MDGIQTGPERVFKQQRLLEDVLWEVYNKDGSSFLETDDQYDKNNLFVHMSVAIRKFIQEGNDPMCVERAFEDRSGFNENRQSDGTQAEEDLKKYYTSMFINLKSDEKKDI